MRFFTYFFPLFFALISFSSEENFKAAQNKYERVRKAYSEKEASLKKLCKEKNINFSSQEIFLRAFKKEGQLEVWSRTKGTSKYILLKSYPICSSSGDLGPKRRQGDGQVPEGFYHIDRYNPSSSYYLSLGVNYPNASDKILGGPRLGGDIFIHGSCVTIGCIPITDEMVKEVYVLFIEAKNSGQSKVPIHIFPCKLSEESFNSLKKEHSDNKAMVLFWGNLKPGYDYFEKNKVLPRITVEANGKYKIS